jgi:hypothetical protein
MWLSLQGNRSVMYIIHAFVCCVPCVYSVYMVSKDMVAAANYVVIEVRASLQFLSICCATCVCRRFGARVLFPSYTFWAAASFWRVEILVLCAAVLTLFSDFHYGGFS